MSKNYDYSYEWDIKYCYPNSFVLRNKFNITNNEELNIAEMEYTSLTISEIKDNPIKGDFNLKYLQDIHRHIFQDIYDWAGKLRTVNISKGNQFCNSTYIVGFAEEIFRKITTPITKEKQEDFIKKIATQNSPVIKAYNLIAENKPLG